jgi:hypothetical protein
MLDGERIIPLKEAARRLSATARRAAAKGSRKRGQPRERAGDADANERHDMPATLPPALWTQKKVAEFLSASKRYVRDSSIPKLLLPGTGPARRPLVRYDPRAVQEWYNLHSADQSAA